MILSEENALRWLWLSQKAEAGAKYIVKVCEYFCDDIEKIYSAELEDYQKITGIGEEQARHLSDKSLDEARDILLFCEKNGVGILTLDSPLYPSRLKRIIDPPLVLYYKGVLTDLDSEVCVAEVGTRTMSEYGSRYAYSVAYDLAKAGAVVVSGMARGVDGMAHRGAIDAGGYTVAVLGSGIDVCYPKEHSGLMSEIISNGIVITEYKPNTKPSPYNFPKRNRIISGLSLGTLVVEAPKKSGSLITVDHAVRQGRDVFVIPGKLGELNSTGTNELIKKGARMITSGADILLEYQQLYPAKIDLNNIPQIKSERLRSPIDLSVAAKLPRSNGCAFSEALKDENSQGTGLKEENIAATVLEETGYALGAETVRKEETGRDEKENNTVDAPAPQRRAYEGLTDIQTRIVDALFGEDKLTTDEIVRKTELGISDVLTEMTMLEISGVVSALPGGRYMLV